MDLTGEYLIDQPRERVWNALNDPDVLAKSLPGCESLTQAADGGFEAIVSQAIGPVKARFKGKVSLEDVNPPESYTLRGEGSGGPAGFAKGEAKVSLAEQDGKTLLTYVVKANVGGQLSRIGQRLIDQAAKKIAEEFFTRFSQEVSGPADTTVEPTGAGSAQQATTQGGIGTGIKWLLAVGVAAIAAAKLLGWL